MTANRLAFLLAALAAIALWQHASGPVSRPPGILAAAAPLQQAVAAGAPALHKDGFVIKPLARFSITARVLSRANYHFDDGAGLVPVDLALGWGRMSDSTILKQISISQSGRFYSWRVSRFPIPRAEIVDSSANMHLIPADSAVERAIERTRVGDVVTFDGYLVEADRPDGFKWVSSLTRRDSGAGACELVWVRHFDIGMR